MQFLIVSNKSQLNGNWQIYNIKSSISKCFSFGNEIELANGETFRLLTGSKFNVCKLFCRLFGSMITQRNGLKIIGGKNEAKLFSKCNNAQKFLF